MNNWIDRLERRYSRFAIPYLINGLMVGQLAAGLIVLLINWQFSGFISLSRSAVLHGQIWRLITFLFQPVWLGGALGILNLVFYFWIGNSLTRAWGDFRMTLFIALGTGSGGVQDHEILLQDRLRHEGDKERGSRVCTAAEVLHVQIAGRA